MSSGHQISDGRSYVYSRGVYLAQGEYFEKSWSGSNLTDAERLLKYKPEHVYDCSILSSSITLGMCRNWTGPGDDFLWTPGSWPANPQLVDPWNGNDDLKLWSKLGTKARDSEFNGGNFLAEFHQVPTLIADISTKMAYVLHQIRNGNDSSLKKFFKKSARNRTSSIDAMKKSLTSSQFYKDVGRNTSEKMSEGLLMYDYGISPLLSDAHDSMNALGQTLNILPYRTRVKSVRAKRTSAVTTGFRWNQSLMHRCTFRGYLASQPSPLTIWHLNDPLSAAVEATPWSFVVDWIIPVSSYFSALDTLRSFEWTSIWKTTMTEYTEIFKGLDPDVMRPGASFEGGSYTKKSVTVKREQIKLSSIAALSAPTIRPAKEVLSVKHMLDAAALAVGVKSRIAKSLKF